MAETKPTPPNGPGPDNELPKPGAPARPDQGLPSGPSRPGTHPDNELPGSESEGSRREKAAAAQGAQAVVDAVKKAADAAAGAAQASARAVDDDGDFPRVTGSPGGRFHIHGNGFHHSGSVLVNGVAVETTGWGNENIEGRLPADVKSGRITVWVDEKTQKHGYLTIV
jgi:hypothetical protein